MHFTNPYFWIIYIRIMSKYILPIKCCVIFVNFDIWGRKSFREFFGFVHSEKKNLSTPSVQHWRLKSTNISNLISCPHFGKSWQILLSLKKLPNEIILPKTVLEARDKSSISRDHPKVVSKAELIRHSNCQSPPHLNQPLISQFDPK